MNGSREELQRLADELAGLRKDLEGERWSAQVSYNRWVTMRERLDNLALRVETALRRAQLQQVDTGGATQTVAPEEVILTVVPETPPPTQPTTPRGTALPAATAPPVGEAVALARGAPRDTLETTIGTYWFARLGAISLLVGFVLFAGYVHQFLTPAMRVGLCYLGALVLCGIGFWSEKSYPKFSRPLLAAGFTLAFFTSFAGHFVEPMYCFDLPTAAVLMIATMTTAVIVAGALRSQALGALSLAMGFWVAGFATKLQNNAFTPVMLIYLGLVGGVFYVAFRWPVLMALSVFGVYLCDVGWDFFGMKIWTGEKLFWVHLAFLTTYFFVFLAGDLLSRLRNRTGKVFANPLAPSTEELCVLVGRFTNPIAYFLVGTLVFMQTPAFREEVHYFYWSLGLLLAVIPVIFRRIESESAREDDVFYVLSVGLITLGFFSAFNESPMALSNILALEALCLFAIGQISRSAIFSYLSAIIYLVAFAHFNYINAENLLKPPVTDWGTIASSLPAALFMLAPIILAPLWNVFADRPAGPAGLNAGPAGLPIGKNTAENRPAAQTTDGQMPLPTTTGSATLNERVLSHIRAILGSAMLLRLFYPNVAESHVTFGLWILLALVLVPVAWTARRYAPALWTLGAAFLFWAHVYFYPQWEKITKNDPWWVFPTAIAMALLVVAIGLLVERAARKRTKNWSEWIGTNAEVWMLLIIVLIAFSAFDLTALVRLRVDETFQYPTASAIAVALVLLAVFTRIAFPSLAGLVFLVVNSLMLMGSLALEDVGRGPSFLVQALLGAGLAVVFERIYHGWADTLPAKSLAWLRHGSLALVALITVILVQLVHAAPWTQRYQCETLGVGGVAVLLLVLGIALQSALYRRFGLGVFVFALFRLYLIDLARLETFYKIIAFLALGAALIVVSFLYSRFKEQFQKWV